MVSVRPATAADIRAYYGAPLPYTVSAVVLIKAGHPVGIIGLATVTGRRILFSEYTPELGEDRGSFAVRRAVIQMARRAMASKLPVFSVKEPDSDVLSRLGFEHHAGDVYKWPSSLPPPPTSPPPVPS